MIKNMKQRDVICGLVPSKLRKRGEAIVDVTTCEAWIDEVRASGESRSLVMLRFHKAILLLPCDPSQLDQHTGSRFADRVRRIAKILLIAASNKSKKDKSG